jgi:hypothetical protein
MDDFKHDVPTSGAGQKNFSQCWLASFEMIYRYHKLPVSSIESKLSAKGIDVTDAKANGMSDKEYYKAAEALGLKGWSGELFKQAASWYDVGLTDGCEAFVEILQAGPLWVSRFIGNGSDGKARYHITVAKGYNDSGSGYIIYNNPWPGPSNANEESIPLNANTYVKHITSAKCSVMGYR